MRSLTSDYSGRHAGLARAAILACDSPVLGTVMPGMWRPQHADFRAKTGHPRRLGEPSP